MGGRSKTQPRTRVRELQSCSASKISQPARDFQSPSSSAAMENFEITDYDLDNEFNPNRKRRKFTKNDAIYGVFNEEDVCVVIEILPTAIFMN